MESVKKQFGRNKIIWFEINFRGNCLDVLLLYVSLVFLLEKEQMRNNTEEYNPFGLKEFQMRRMKPVRRFWKRLLDFSKNQT